VILSVDLADASPPVAPERTRIEALYQNLPLAFEPNRGQTDRSVRFLSRGTGYTLFLTSTEAVLVLRAPNQVSTPRRQPVIRMRFLGTTGATSVRAERELPGKSHYFIGNNPRHWQHAVPHYERVVYQNLYPGIDLVFYGSRGEIEFDLVLHPSADPSRITLAVDGAQQIRTSGAGDLRLRVETAEIVLRKPVIYQEGTNGRSIVPGRYRRQGTNLIGFEIGPYDRTRPLVIDPSLSNSSYLGGTGPDTANGIAVDSIGNVYVVGRTESPNFPTSTSPLAFDTSLSAFSDAFITKLNPNAATAATALLYSTYLGGDGNDSANAVAIDSTGNVYVAGSTTSSNFPTSTSPLAFQATPSGLGEAFITKLNPSAAPATALLYSTYLGGNGLDTANGLAVDSSGNVYVTGSTESSNFPTSTSPLAFDTALDAFSDAFLTKLNPTAAPASALLYSTYLGGDGIDVGRAITINTLGHAFITGRTESTDFTLTTIPAAFQTTLSGPADAFVTKLDPAAAPASAVMYSTYLGGDGADEGKAIAVDTSGNAFITGNTASTNFPTSTSPLAFQTSLVGPGDVFVTKLNPTVGPATAILYSTYLGGDGGESGNGIVVNTSGHVFIAGNTNSNNFPLPTSPAAFQATLAGPGDAFVTKLNPTASPSAALLYSSYLGGDGVDVANAIRLDTGGNALVTGNTASSTFPVTTATSTTTVAFQSTFGGGAEPGDAFISRVIESSGSSGGEGFNVGGDDGGCFIATAAFGSPLAKEVRTLRAFRDRYLLTSGIGRLLVKAYYQISPSVAVTIAPHETARALVRLSLLPAIWYAQLALLSPFLALLTAMGMMLLALALIISPIRRK
jgi:hypothetical protein